MSEDTPLIVSATKALVPGPEWIPFAPSRHQVVFSLDDVAGVTIEGARVRLLSFDDLPQRAVTIQLEYPQADRRDHAVERIDWKPLHTHCNGGKGPQEHRYRPIEGTHRHSFELNWLDDQKRLRIQNLPIAVPVNPDLQLFPDLLEFAANCLRIPNLVDVAPPPWIEEDLFHRWQ